MFSTMQARGVRSIKCWATIGGAVGIFLLCAAARGADKGPQHARDATHDARWPNESKIAAALDERTELDFADQPLSDVIDYLKQRHEIEIQLDQKALTDAGVGSDTPITQSIKGITLDSALDLIFSQLDLTWVIHDEVLYITSIAQADTMIETRVYPVRDLLADDAAGTEKDFYNLVSCFQMAADTKGPKSDVLSHEPAFALVVTCPIRAHYRIEKLLNDLRTAKAQADR